MAIYIESDISPVINYGNFPSPLLLLLLRINQKFIHLACKLCMTRMKAIQGENED